MLLIFTSFTATGLEERNFFSITVSLNFKLCSSHLCCHKKIVKQDFVLFFSKMQTNETGCQKNG